jgi:hypothetical protein
VRRTVVHFLAIAVVLGGIAAAAPHPVSDDRGVYVDIGRQVPLPDCWNLHCGRVLVAAVLEHLPGPSLLKWKLYAVLANAGAAVAVGRFSVAVGLPERSWALATWISALGSGSLYSVFDCYTSDPLMYLMGPVLSVLLLHGRNLRAGLLSALTVFAKEFAAVPLWTFTIVAVLRRRWEQAQETLLLATTVTLVWLAEQTLLFALYNYGYGSNKSADILRGGYLALWISSVGAFGAVKYLFLTFGALYILLPLGFMRAPRQLRLVAIASVPAILAFVYVQQPERALWNFHFLAIPIAVAALINLPAWASWLFVASFGITNLRVGAQLQTSHLGRIATIVAIALAFAAVWRGAADKRHLGALT